jgi:hypothetical protein
VKWGSRLCTECTASKTKQNNNNNNNKEICMWKVTLSSQGDSSGEVT